MSKEKKIKAGISLHSLNIVNSGFSIPPERDLSLTDFKFDVAINMHGDISNELIMVTVTVEIRSNNAKYLLGRLSLNCTYGISNFKDAVKVSTSGELDLPKELVIQLNATSISTTRGAMFSTFKGTFLHNAFLPIVDPSNFIITKSPETPE